MYVIVQFLRVRSETWFYWVVLAQGLSGGSSQEGLIFIPSLLNHIIRDRGVGIAILDAFRGLAGNVYA